MTLNKIVSSAASKTENRTKNIIVVVITDEVLTPDNDAPVVNRS